MLLLLYIYYIIISEQQANLSKLNFTKKNIFLHILFYHNQNEMLKQEFYTN